MRPGDKRLTVQWDDYEGDYIYTLEQFIPISFSTPSKGDWSMVFISNQRTNNQLASGLIDWATRVADHYKIEVPDATR